MIKILVYELKVVGSKAYITMKKYYGSIISYELKNINIVWLKNMKVTITKNFYFPQNEGSCLPMSHLVSGIFHEI